MHTLSRVDRLVSRSTETPCLIKGLPLTCWTTEGTNNSGYSLLWDGTRRHVAHRYMYVELIAPVPDGTELDHLCQNPACWNPWHLDPVPHVVNVRRGSVAAANRSRVQPSHCPKGHEFTEANTARRSNGKRYCRECRREFDRNRPPRDRAQEKARRPVSLPERS